jgi:hypothetical protein
MSAGAVPCQLGPAIRQLPRAVPVVHLPAEYRKFKRPFPPTARTHPVVHPAPPGALPQPHQRLASPVGSWQAAGRLARLLVAPTDRTGSW